MDRKQYIAEAKKRGYSDSSIQELLFLYDQCARDGFPMEYSFPEGSLSADEIDITCSDNLISV